MLFSSYHIICASKFQDADSSIKTLNTHVLNNFLPVLKKNITAGTFSETHAESHKILAEEKEESADEFVFAQKYIELSAFFTSFYTQATVYFFPNLTKLTLVREHDSYFSFCRYIVLRVFRI